ncbi:MAG: DUF262 domain-containing protein [Caldimicrobium sp.]|nr:DUF262 domain-containing protein [Caldimicrobium sp.]MCX7874077.1 DUF262 domain-containing protein [Caldimicrobium sp.]MDW8094365.1 DUF262 domain-containing protein [Caldimicrobium sp.]
MGVRVIDFVREIHDGIIVLPDFQRSFVWEPEDVRELLVSVLGNYFIGSMLLLEHHKDNSPFALRLVEGVEKINKDVKMQSTVKILLDGQQRSSALFYALYEPKIPLKNRKGPYRFYLDLDKALERQWDSAVIAVSENDKIKQNEIKKNKSIIPFSLLKDIGELAKQFKDDPRFDKIVTLANNFQNYEIHTVFLPRDTDLEKIVETFERINRTGKPLSIFDLLTAKLYRNGVKLRELLEDAKKNYEFLKFISPEFILKVIALIRGKEPRRKNIFELDPQNFKEDWERACRALEKAYNRVVDIKNGYGVLDFKKWMPYTTMLVPLAVMIDFIETKRIKTSLNYDKIDCWYWTAVFSNRYDQAVDATSANDFKAVKDWIENNKEPEFIQKFNCEEVNLDVDKQSSAIYRGVINLIILQGAYDFKTGQPPQFDKEKVQDDHIFPKSRFSQHPFVNVDSIINKTLLTTNVEKSNKKPSEYFGELIKLHGEEKLKSILESHIIPFDALDDLLSDNIESFLQKRKSAIIKSIRKRLRRAN